MFRHPHGAQRHEGVRMEAINEGAGNEEKTGPHRWKGEVLSVDALQSRCTGLS